MVDDDDDDDDNDYYKYIFGMEWYIVYSIYNI